MATVKTTTAADYLASKGVKTKQKNSSGATSYSWEQDLREARRRIEERRVAELEAAAKAEADRIEAEKAALNARMQNTYIPTSLAQNVLASNGETPGTKYVTNTGAAKKKETTAGNFNALVSNTIRSQYNPTETSAGRYAQTYLDAKTKGRGYIPTSIGAQLVENAQRAAAERQTLAPELRPYQDLSLMRDYASGAYAGKHYEPIPHTVDAFADLHAYINDTDGRRTIERQRNGQYRNGSIYDHLTQAEINNFNYLTGAKGKEAAEKYLEDMMPTLNERKAVALAKSIEESEKTTAGRIAGSINSAFLAPLVGAGYVGAAIDKATGKEIDPNAPYLQFATAQNKMRSEASKEMGAVGKFLYDAGMSVADVLVNTALTGGAGLTGKAAAGASGMLMGSGAATSTMADAIERGATEEQAMIAGGLSGIAESLFESLSIGNLLNVVKQSGTKGLANALRRATGNVAGGIIEQMTVEASEEALTEVANYLVDYLVMGGLSRFDQEVYAAMQTGMKREDAERQAKKNLVKEVGLSALGGALSGGALGGAGAWAGSLAQRTQQNAEAAERGQRITPYAAQMQRTAQNQPVEAAAETEAREPAAAEQTAQGTDEAPQRRREPTPEEAKALETLKEEKEAIERRIKKAEERLSQKKDKTSESYKAKQRYIENQRARLDDVNARIDAAENGLLETETPKQITEMQQPVTEERIRAEEPTDQPQPLPITEDTAQLLPVVEEPAQLLPSAETHQAQQPQPLPSVNEVSETAKTEKKSRETNVEPKAAINRMAVHDALDAYQKAYGITNDARDMASEAAFYVVERIAADGAVPKKAANRAFEILWNAGENIPETVVKEEARQEYLGELERVGMEAHNAVRRAKTENDSAEAAERLFREMDAEYREKQRTEEEKISAGNAMLEAWRAEQKNKDESRGEREREGRNLSKDLERYKKRQEAEFVDAMESLFEIPKEERESVRKAVSKIGEDIIKTGTLSEEKQASLFKIIWDTGVFYADEANARIAFDDVLFDFRRKMNLVDANARAMERHVREQRKEKKKADAKNLALVKATLKGYKTAERKATAAETKYGPVLSDGDRAVINALHKGGLTLDKIKERSNFKEIFAVYKAQQEKMEAQSIIKEFNDTRRKRLHDEAMRALETSDAWKDKKIGLLYERETQERNVRDIVKDPAEAERVVQTYFEPVHENEAEKTRFINQMNERVKNLKLNKQERQAAQLMGEREDYIERLKDEGVIAKNATSAEGAKPKTKYQKLLLDGYDVTTKKLDELRESKGGKINDAKCNEAIKEMRAVYDEFFSMMNDALMRNGYAPVEYRKNYFPHFSSRKGDTAFGELGRALGFNATDADLPTSIAGLTATFKPGKTWFSNALERSGIETDYDIVEGFENYAKGAADIIFHTDDIQRLRALENAIRYKYSDEGRKKRAREITENEDLTPEQRQEMLDAVYKDSDGRMMTSKLSHYVENLTEYTNLLANKKSIADRGAEKALGRVMYDLADWVQRRFAGNAIKGSVSVAASNFIPLTQALGGVSPTHLAKGMLDTVKNVAKKDGFADRSDFITNRRGADSLTKTAVQKAGDVLTKPLDMVDDIVSEAIVRARYQKNIKNKMSEAEAMRDADRFAANVMADRSKGATPTIFGKKNLLAKTFTTFQVEVNNQLSFLLKDVPKDSAEGKAKAAGIAAVAHAFFKIFLAAFLYNELDEKVTGNRRALDPVGIVKEAIEDGLAVEAGEMKAFDAVSQTWEAVMGNVPFIGSALGGDGGRSPAAGALPDVGALAKTVINAKAEDGEVDAAYVAQEVLDELKKPLYYLLPPFAGGQIKKTIEGIQTVNRGGSFKTDKEGNLKMQFRTDQKPGKYLQAGLFGKWSLPEAREYIDKGFPIMSAKQTAAYMDAVENGVNGARWIEIRDAYKDMKPIKDEEGKTVKSTTDQLREYLFKLNGLTPEQKQLIEKGLADNTRQADYANRERFDISIADSEATYIPGVRPYDRFTANIESGMSEEDAILVEQYAALKQTFKTVENEDGTKTGPKQQMRVALLEDDSLTPEQKQLIDEALFAADSEDYSPPDYGSEDAFAVSQMSESARESARQFEQTYGGDIGTFKKYYDFEAGLENDVDKWGNEISGSAREHFRQELFDDDTLTPREKAALDELITGSNRRSYESEFAFELTGISEKAYERGRAYVAGGVSEEDAVAVEEWMREHKNFKKEELGDYMEETLGMTKEQRATVYKTRYSSK